MKLTSMDISNKEFRKAMRGYDAEEVNDFLERVSEDYEILYKENSSLKEKVQALSEKIEHYGKMETTIQNTLLLAQNAADQARVVAQKEADLIVCNANDSAKKVIDKSNMGVMQINEDFDRAKGEFMKFRAQYKNFMNTQIDMFTSLEKEFNEKYNIGAPLIEEIPVIKEQKEQLEEKTTSMEKQEDLLPKEAEQNDNDDDDFGSFTDDIDNFGGDFNNLKDSFDFKNQKEDDFSDDTFQDIKNFFAK